MANKEDRQTDMRKGSWATFLVETEMRPGEYTLIEVDGAYHLAIFEESDRATRVRLKAVKEFTSIDEAEAALARARGEKMQ